MKDVEISSGEAKAKIDKDSSAVVKEIQDLLPSKERTMLKSSYLNQLKPVFAYLKDRKLSISAFRNNSLLFYSLGERTDQLTIQWISKNYKKYRWLIGFTGVKKGFRLVECFQCMLISYYSGNCSTQKMMKYVTEIVFDRFIQNEISNYEFHLKSLVDMYELSLSNFELRRVSSFQAKFIVRMLLMSRDKTKVVRFACRVMQTVEMIILEMLKLKNITPRIPMKSDGAYKIIFYQRWKQITVNPKKFKGSVSEYGTVMFVFCLQILSPLFDEGGFQNSDDCNTILRYKRFIQSGLLVLNDKNLIAQFQCINWAVVENEEDVAVIPITESETELS